MADFLRQILQGSNWQLTSADGAPMEPAPPSEERRKSPRIEGKPVGIILASDEARMQSVHGVVVNHSSEGLRVLVEHKAELGTTLYVRQAEPSGPDVWIPIEIRHQRPYDHCWVLGCRFVEKPAPETLRFYAWVQGRA